MNRPLRVFLCHSSNDKPAMRELYQKLRAEPWIQPWLDEEELYPGQDWDIEIQKAVEESDVVLVCLSTNSITKRGYIQKELRYVVDIALEIPEEEIFIIPLRLEECTPPRSLREWQYADYFPESQRERAFQRLLVSLKRRADPLSLKIETSEPKKEEKSVESKKLVIEKSKRTLIHQLSSKQKFTPSGFLVEILSNGMEFMRVPAGEFLMGSNKYKDESPQHRIDIPYNYWMARFPVTNEQYNAYIQTKEIKHPVKGWGKKKKHPVVYVNWNDAMDYCEWLSDLLKGEMPSGLVLRLPTDAEWEKSASGTDGSEFPWGSEFRHYKCNSKADNKGITTSVGLYSRHGDSPYGCADMAGNVWEWTHSFYRPYPYVADDGRENNVGNEKRVVRGGSWFSDRGCVRSAYRDRFNPTTAFDHIGFRCVCSVPLF